MSLTLYLFWIEKISIFIRKYYVLILMLSSLKFISFFKFKAIWAWTGRVGHGPLKSDPLRGWASGRGGPGPSRTCRTRPVDIPTTEQKPAAPLSPSIPIVCSPFLFVGKKENCVREGEGDTGGVRSARGGVAGRGQRRWCGTVSSLSTTPSNSFLFLVFFTIHRWKYFTCRALSLPLTSVNTCD